jgi:hypothetical protein
MSIAPRLPRPLPGEVAALALAVAAAVAGVVIGLATGLSAALPVAPHLYGTTDELVAIAARNLSVCSALIFAPHARPLRTRWPRNVVDVLAFVVLVPTTFTVAAIAAHPGGLAYLPHAPLELTAIALSAAWWWRHHHAAPAPADTARRALLVAGLLLLAAPLETFLVPHR